MNAKTRSRYTSDYDEEDTREIRGVKFNSEKDKKGFKKLRDQMRKIKSYNKEEYEE